MLVSGDDATLAAIAIGALLYTAVNGPGSSADRGQWPIVALFGVLAAVGAVVSRGPLLTVPAPSA